MAGRTINPLCGLSEFWSLRCCTEMLLVLLASSMATVTLNACQAGLTCSSNAQEVPFFTMPLPPALLLLLLWEVKLEGGEKCESNEDVSEANAGCVLWKTDCSFLSQGVLN